MSARLRREDGHTLPELLTALMMATVILLATFALLDHVLNRTAETQARVEATQKGRQAMDTMTRAIRSSVCLSATTPAISRRVGHVADLLLRPRRRHQAAGEARADLQPDDAAAHAGGLPGHRHAAGHDVHRHPASQNRQLAENIELDGTTPMFRFYAYNTATPPTATLRARRTRWPPPTSGASPASSITYVARGGGLRDAARPRARPARSPTTSTSAAPTRTTPPPTRHAHEPDPRLRARLGDESGFSMLRGDARDDRGHDVRHRRLRGRERRPADEPQLAGPQGDLRGGRGGGELLPVPPQRRQRLLDEVHERRQAERDREQPGQPAVERRGRPTRASGATSPARPRSTRSSCCPPRAGRSASRATSRA